MTNGQKGKIGVIVVCFTVALVVVGMQMVGEDPGGTPDINWYWYYDLQTKELFRGEVGNRKAPPIPAPSGGDGVRAHVYGCGNCDGDTWIGHLEKYGPEAKAHWESHGSDQDIITAGHFTSTEEGKDWHTYLSDEGQAILAEPQNKCPKGVKLVPCRPPQE